MKIAIPRSSNRSLFFLIAILLSVGAIAAGCGDSDGDDGDTAASGDGGSSEDGASGDLADLSGSIVASGSSTVAPVTIRAAELFEDLAPDVAITVNGPGTGDGFKQFCTGETDISGASRSIKESEAQECADADITYTELKVAFDGIAVMTSPANDVECVTFGDLYSLLGPESQGFSNWSDAQGLADELGGANTFPDAPLEISAPGTESGTYDSFIEIVLEGLVEERLGEDPASSIRTDIPGIAEDNVIIQGITGSDSSLGWVGFAFAEENRDAVKTLQVDNGESGCTSPTIETIADGSYPVSRPLFIYVNNDKAASNPALAAFVDFYLADGYTSAVTEAFGDSGYVELPEDQLQESKDAWTGR